MIPRPDSPVWFPAREAFAAAERLSDDLYTKSISEGAFSLISNDNAISYRARPYEMAMVPYFRALNYLALGLPVISCPVREVELDNALEAYPDIEVTKNEVRIPGYFEDGAQYANAWLASHPDLDHVLAGVGRMVHQMLPCLALR
mgnify:CR=1 FL=1